MLLAPGTAEAGIAEYKQLTDSSLVLPHLTTDPINTFLALNDFFAFRACSRVHRDNWDEWLSLYHWGPHHVMMRRTAEDAYLDDLLQDEDGSGDAFWA